MRNGRWKLLGLAGEEVGQTTLEYALLLAVFAVPMLYVFTILLSVLAEHYAMVTFLETLPFP